MALPQYIYGDSYGDVGNRMLSYDQARDSRYFNSLQAQRAQDALEASQQASQSDQQFRWSALLAQLAAQKRAEEAQRSQFGQLRDVDMLKLMMNQNQFAQNLGLAREQMKATQGEKDYGEAAGAVQSGLMFPPDVAKDFPNMSPIQIARLTQYHDALAKQEDEEQKNARTVALNLNAQLEMKRHLNALLDPLNAEKEKNKGFGTFNIFQRNNSTIDEDIGKVNRGEIPLPKTGGSLKSADLVNPTGFVETVLKNPRVSSMVQFDPETQSFIPITKPRRFTLNGHVVTPTTVPPNADPGSAVTPNPGADLSGFTTNGAIKRFRFNPSTGQIEPILE